MTYVRLLACAFPSMTMCRGVKSYALPPDSSGPASATWRRDGKHMVNPMEFSLAFPLYCLVEGPDSEAGSKDLGA